MARRDPAMSAGVNVANAQDAVVVVAAGNDATDNDSAPTIPCNLPQPNLICVASLTNTGALSSFSNFGLEGGRRRAWQPRAEREDRLRQPAHQSQLRHGRRQVDGLRHADVGQDHETQLVAGVSHRQPGTKYPNNADETATPDRELHRPKGCRFGLAARVDIEAGGATSWTSMREGQPQRPPFAEPDGLERGSFSRARTPRGIRRPHAA